jgi:ureidoacrylate peracid hydrolase
MSEKIPEELLTPERVALVVIDMQEAFVGLKASIPVPNAGLVIRRVASLVEALRPKVSMLAWTQVTLDSSHSGPYSLLFPQHFDGNLPLTLRQSSPDFQIVPSLRPHVRCDDIAIVKHRYSAFHGTPFESILRSRGITTLIFCGVTTNVCVETSIRDAYSRGFYCILVSDCTATFSKRLQKASEEVVGFVFGWVMSTRKLLSMLGKE